MNLTEKKLSSRSVFSGKIFSVTVDEVELPDKSKSVRECVRHNGGAAVLLVIEGKIALVKQHRYLYGKDIYEIPAGKTEAGEEPLLAAMRECEEETGYRTECRHLLALYPSPGYTSEVIHIFTAHNARFVGQRTDEGGVSHLQVFPRGRGCFYDRARGNLRCKDGCGGV